MRHIAVALALALCACSCRTGGAARVGKPEPGKTRYGCKGQNRVVDDPAKCEQPEGPHR